MKIQDTFDLSRSEWENLIDEWVFSERDMALLKFPALQKYKSEHSTENLQKLCAEIKAFCKAVYASTGNEEERNVCLLMLTTFD